MKSLKMKLTSMILATVIAMSVMIVGVLAVTNVSLNIGGTINFIVVPTDVYLNSVTLKNTVTQSSNGYQANDVTLSEYSDLYIQEDTSLDLSNVEVLAGQTMEIDIAMTSLNENYLKVNLTYNNLPSTVTINSTSLYMPQNTTGDLADGQERTYKIYIKNTANTSLNLSSINLNVSFEEKTSLLQQGVSEYTGKNMWYVEMGTIPTSTGNEYIKWRYFSNGSTHYDYSATAPTGMGYFIMETYNSSFVSTAIGGLRVSFNNDYVMMSSDDATHNQNGWTNINANDYSTSTIRQYINGNNVQKSSSSLYDSTSETTTFIPNGTTSNMYKDLNIDIENDLVYSKIIGRSLSDLYTNMGWDWEPSSPTFPNVDFPDFTGASIVYNETDTDKFWILSDYEAYNLLSNGVNGDSMDSSSTDREWGDYYWFRSPNFDEVYTVYCIGIGGGLYGYNDVWDDSLLARPAFNFMI